MKPTKEQIEKWQRDWFEENHEVGQKLGYPECCIKAFCDDTPQMINLGLLSRKEGYKRYKAGCIDGKFTGFIPCQSHAIKILSGEITLTSLVNNRSNIFPPFPNWGAHDE